MTKCQADQVTISMKTMHFIGTEYGQLTADYFSLRIGTPPTNAPGGTSRLTRLMAEITAPSPITEG